MSVNFRLFRNIDKWNMKNNQFENVLSHLLILMSGIGKISIDYIFKIYGTI